MHASACLPDPSRAAKGLGGCQGVCVYGVPIRKRGGRAGNRRNGTGTKTVPPASDAIDLSIPRDRHNRFDATLIAMYRHRFPGHPGEDRCACTHGTSTRDTIGHLIRYTMQFASRKECRAIADAAADLPGRQRRAWLARTQGARSRPAKEPNVS
ncbi:protein of unknown function [Burkholderia multivorans]